jgi:hypothetical protein
MGHRLVAIDHVQLAMPRGAEDEATAFYTGLLGLERQAKPPALAARGGCWFSNGEVDVHLGVEDGFRPARRPIPPSPSTASTPWRPISRVPATSSAGTTSYPKFIAATWTIPSATASS